MPYLNLIKQGWAKANDEQRRELALLLASLIDVLEARLLAPPVLLVPGEKWPTQEQIRKAMAKGAPVIRIEYVARQSTVGVDSDRTPNGQQPE